MTPEEQTRAKELCEKATAGPWRADKQYDGGLIMKPHPPYKDEFLAGLVHRDNDCYFIAESRDLLPKAIAEIEKSQQEIRSLRNEVLDLAALISAYRKWQSEAPIK